MALLHCELDSGQFSESLPYPGVHPMEIGGVQHLKSDSRCLKISYSLKSSEHQVQA